MEKIVMVDLHAQYQRIKPEIDEAIQGVLNATAFIQGPQVTSFSNALSKYNDGVNVVTCGNGTDALQIALMGLGLEPGDEVILPVFTYVATAEVIALLRLVPVFVDVDPRTFNIDVELARRRVTAKTKAIVPVHLFGQCAPMESIMKLAGDHGLFVVEDAAQSLGAEYIFSDGRRVKSGCIGHIGCTSFFPSKNLGCFGDGGAMLSADRDLAARLKIIANHGQEVKYYHSLIGVNSRLDTLQAAVLQVKLAYLDDYTKKRNFVATIYDNTLGDIEGLILPFRAPYSTHAFNQYTIQVAHKKRDALKSYLATKGIPTMIYYPLPLHFQKAYAFDGLGEGSFPTAEKLCQSVLSLPIHTELTEEQVSFICTEVRSFFGHA